MKVMIVVTHLLGTGHLARAATLGRACAAAGQTVMLVSGGGSVAHIDTSAVTFLQLPPLRSDGVNFSSLLDPDGQPATADYLRRRRGMLRDTLHQFQPDVLITELFPFGRRNLQAEFLALLEAAVALPKAPVILSSVRDILAPPSSSEKAQLTEDRISRYYNAVLVHSDPAITPLDLSWPVTPVLQNRLRYTGFVAHPPPTPHPDGAGQGEILVSTGGGNVGLPVYHAAIAAARDDTAHAWRLLVGGVDAPRTCAVLARDAGPNVIVEPARPDFRQMLCHAAASVSMCGYNTALDVLQAGTPAVWIPFDAGGEVEQGLRAQALAHLDGMEVVPSQDLDGPHLRAAIRHVLSAPRRRAGHIRFDGADTTAETLRNLVEARS